MSTSSTIRRGGMPVFFSLAILVASRRGRGQSFEDEYLLGRVADAELKHRFLFGGIPSVHRTLLFHYQKRCLNMAFHGFANRSSEEASAICIPSARFMSEHRIGRC